MTKTRHFGTRFSPFVLAMVIAALFAAPASAQESSGGAYPPGTVPPSTTNGSSPYDKQGQWIWYVDKSEAGSYGKIIARAKRNRIGTVYVKSGDGSDYWTQFSKAMVTHLHAGGLDVCAWQFVYGDHPAAEAAVAAAAVKKGADCFVIDAEGDYEGKYAAADRYMRLLRAKVGAAYPISIAGFPYVDYHPSYPYSVFMGPGGAQFNQPQMYWKAIQTSVRAVFEHTYLFNRVYGAPIHPIGQTYDAVTIRDILRFRRYSASYGDLQPSWWSWQETKGPEWGALATKIPGPVEGYRPITRSPTLRAGSEGDLVVWAQQHLVGSGAANLPVSGIFGPKTRKAVRTFQAKRKITADGVIGNGTWKALLRVRPVRINWAKRARRSSARSTVGTSALTAPLSASLPAVEYEIDPGPRP